MTHNTNVYIFSGESYMVNKSVKELKSKVENVELNFTEFLTVPNAASLEEACAQLPFMSDMRLVVVTGCSALSASKSADEAKEMLTCIKKMPKTTVLAMCSDMPPDKRRTLYKYVKQNGAVTHFKTPDMSACVSFIVRQVNGQGAKISSQAARQLVNTAGCDYYTLENEVDKLVIYSGFGEITLKHISECASRSLEYNVFEMHRLLAQRQADKAYALLADILERERPEALIGLFARKVRDMYKIKTMCDAGFSQLQIEEQLRMGSYAVSMLAGECARFTPDSLRQSIKMLADTDYGIKSGKMDAFPALSKTLINIYGL